MDTHKKNRTAPALICDLFGLSFFSKLFSWLIGESLQLSQVEVVYQALIPSSISEHIVNCPVQFESSGNAFSFNPALLRRPVVRTHKELVELLRLAPFELIALAPRTAVSDQLERIFRKLLQESAPLPSLEQIAHQVGQTVSTLRRHLAQDDTSYQDIIDKCRMERAVELLQRTAMTVDDISVHLGYSASSSFSRAFKDWTGCAPSFYRQALAEQEKRCASA
jgi:AraC-like DNA-binding protein